ncbi:MAG: SDR family oxidoreductase [Methylobacteriaceae bacterium]|nr:SDR family oxidoreductase [Methylobacteriaceae bacterium]
MSAKAAPPVAIVTGAARRIGAGIVQRLAREGYALILHASPASKAEGEAQAARIREGGGHAIPIACDLARVDASAVLFGAAERDLGPITLLVNNASAFEPDHAEDFSADLFERHIVVNLRAPLLLAQEMRRRLPADRHGAIVNIIDQRVLRPNPMYFTYSISKSALWTATIMMAQAFAPRIRVNAIGPGPVLPNAYDGELAFAEEAAALPLKQPASLADICDALVYLTKATSVTGQLIAVDGGQHIAWKTPDILALNPRSAADES